MVDSFKLSDGDIDSVLSALELYTGRTVVRPGQLPTANYSLKISRPIPKAELVTALETLLELNGVSVSPMGERFLKVTALSQAKSEAPEMIIGSSLDLPASGKIATKVFELNFLRVSEFVPQIMSFMTPGIGGGIVQLEKANVAMVTDSLENIQRIERLLSQVDHPRENSLTPKFYTLKNGAKASDVVTKIHAMFAGAATNQLRATTTYTPDDRTNQVIVIADPREIPLFDSIIAQLDIKSDPFTKMEVMPLKHGDAKDVATLLTNLISGQNAAVQKNSSTSVRPGQIALPGQPPAPIPNGAAAAATAAAEGVNSSEFSGLVTVQPDERTNSIVVSGTFDDIRLIKGIVEKIDVLLAQVSIQVVIAEVTLTDSDQNGISALGLQVGPTANGGTSITGFSGSIAGWTVGSATGGLTSPNPLSFLAELQAAGDKHKVKILQADTITTTHNKAATLRQRAGARDHGDDRRPPGHHDDLEQLCDLVHRHLQGHRDHAQGDAPHRRRRQHPAEHRPDGRRRPGKHDDRRQLPADHRTPRGHGLHQRNRRPIGRPRRPPEFGTHDGHPEARAFLRDPLHQRPLWGAHEDA